MSVYACLGSDAAAIRDAFLIRLQSRTEDVRIKVMTLEFLTVAVETQPGLIELFLNLEVKDGPEGSKVSPREGPAALGEVRVGWCGYARRVSAGVPAGRVELSAGGPGPDGLQAAGKVLVPPAPAPGRGGLPARAVARPPRERHLSAAYQVRDTHTHRPDRNAP